MDITILWTESLTLNKLASKNLHLATTFLQFNSRQKALQWEPTYPTESLQIYTLFYYKATQSFASLAHRSSECAVVSEIQTLDASINLSCQSANNLNREMYSEKESYWVFFHPPYTAHISFRPDFRTLLAQETFATVSSLQNALYSTSLS